MLSAGGILNFPDWVLPICEDFIMIVSKRELLRDDAAVGYDDDMCCVLIDFFTWGGYYSFPENSCFNLPG